MSVPAAPRGVAPSPVAAAPAPTSAPRPSPSASVVPVGAAVATSDGAGKGGAGKGAAFRETLWFKKGDVDQMVADAKAKLAAQGRGATGTGEVPIPGEDVRPIEDRYVDDGSVTTEDRQKFSLRSSNIGMSSQSRRSRPVPGDAMSEKDVINEMAGTRRTLILVVVGVLVAAVIAVVVSRMRGKGGEPIGTAEPAGGGPGAAVAAPVAPAAVVPVTAPPPSPASAATASKKPAVPTRSGADRKSARKKKRPR